MSEKKILTVKQPTSILDSYYEDEDLQKELDSISNDVLLSADQTRVIKNIKKNLANTLKKKYGFSNGELKDLTSKILKIHGLDAENFDVLQNFGRLMTERLNDVSVDDNSNRNEKTIASIMKDVSICNDKLIGYHSLYQIIKELYGKDIAKRLMGEMYDYSLGLADSSKILSVYCYAFNMSKLVLEGRKFGKLWSSPPHRVDSYIAALDETVHQLSNHLAGACAISSFFLDICHIMIYKERKSLKELKENTVLRKRIQDLYQTFIHSVNHNSRNASESPFTNVSIFDRVKLEKMIADDNMGWYFPKKDAVIIDNEFDGTITKEDFKKFVINYILELQNIYMDFVEKGDPLHNGMPYAFPVNTINISKDENNEILDEEFFKVACQRDISRYNIFTSIGTKIASCCRLISDSELMDSASSVNSFGGAAMSMGSHRVVNVNLERIALEATSMKNFYKILEKRINDAGKILKAHKVLIAKLEQKGLQPFITRGWINMSRLFSTFGILGHYEMGDIIHNKFAEELTNINDVTADILIFFDETVKKVAKELDIVANIEAIPGESYCVRLAKVNDLLFPDNKLRNAPLLANQFVPLWKKISIWDKMDIEGKYLKYITGGAITHIQVGSQTTPSQNEKLIRYAIKSGAEHFAINHIFSICNKCNKSFNVKVAKCLDCGSDDVDYYTRVVGFITSVKDWNETRRNWEFDKRQFLDDSLTN